MPDVKTSLWLFGLVALIPACGFAQVTVNPAALGPLEGLAPAAPAAKAVPAMARPPVPRAAIHHDHHAKPETIPPPAKPHAVPPLISKPAHPPASPKPVTPPVARIEFGVGSYALPADATRALKPFCTASLQIPVIARAPADPNDPSGAMRLSMNRAFAIRDALIACGVPAQKIIPRAVGSVPGTDDNQAQIGASAAP